MESFLLQRFISPVSFCFLYVVDDSSLLGSSIIAIGGTLFWLGSLPSGTSNLFAFLTNSLLG